AICSTWRSGERGFHPRYTSSIMRFASPIAAAILFSITPASLPGQMEGGFDTSHLQTIQPRLQALVDKQIIPGSVALVARHRKVAFREAVGWSDIENKKPMQVNSI